MFLVSALFFDRKISTITSLHSLDMREYRPILERTSRAYNSPTGERDQMLTTLSSDNMELQADVNVRRSVMTAVNYFLSRKYFNNRLYLLHFL